MIFLKFRFVLYIFIVIALFNTCNYSKTSYDKNQIDLDHILKKGRLVAITDNNTLNYFFYKGRPYGFQLELLENYANFLGVELEIVTNNSIRESFSMLDAGYCDILALNLNSNSDREKNFFFTAPIYYSRKVLIQRVNTIKLNSFKKLAYNKVYVTRGSDAFNTLSNVSDSIWGFVNIEESDLKSEALVKMVASKQIDFAIVDESIAVAASQYFQNIDISFVIEDYKPLSWSVRHESPELLYSLNMWIESFKKTRRYSVLYDKYFADRKYLSMVYINKSNVIKGNSISKYDDIIKEQSIELDWDWRIVASLMYKESRFDHTAVSYRGAFGVMQMMPETAKRFGLDSSCTPQQQIKAGIKYLILLNKYFSKTITNKDERIKFVLASYNIGIGHILDAQKIAEKLDYNPLIWDQNVAICLMKKSEPAIYNDPDIKFGYAKGRQTFEYVADVMKLYSHYRNVLD